MFFDEDLLTAVKLGPKFHYLQHDELAQVIEDSWRTDTFDIDTGRPLAEEMTAEEKDFYTKWDHGYCKGE
jgi:hypothetical protein